MSRSLVLAVAFGIAAAVPTLPAHGQTLILVEPPVAEAQVPPYSDEELQQFAGAAISVQRINDDVAPKLEAAGSPEEQQELAQAASIEMVQAVEGKGMSVDRFEEILYHAQTNPLVAQRVAQLIESFPR